MVQGNKRLDFRVRYCPYADTPDAVLLAYLFSELDGKRMMLNAARMCYFALAQKQVGSMNSEQLRQLALDSCDQLEKHIWYIRTSFGLFGDESTSKALASDFKNKIEKESTLTSQSQPLSRSQNSSTDEVTIADINEIFEVS